MDYARDSHKMSIRQALRLFQIHPSVYYYKPLPDGDEDIREKLSELSQLHNRWGFWMMHHYLRNLNHKWNHKRVYRVYTEMGLNMRRKHKKRLPARIMEPLLQPLRPNITWSMDFMHDTLSNGVTFRSFNIIDDYNREALNITIDTNLTSKRIIRQLDQLIAWRGQPLKIRVDNGPEFVAEALSQWAEIRCVELKFIQKGKPFQNGYMERFNRSYREEVLDAFCFTRLGEAQILSNAWMWVYNNQRPHKALGYRSPIDFLCRHQKTNTFPTLQKDEGFEWETLVENVTV
ncbi:IS3 family transposase [Chitinophaga oryzae]|uniref:IS3 family transposase n=1 Tax=Chitinophaga oryzae TaxID=2725414 RepID=A0AAE7D7F0_9BACT|nr:IS3 family transposase [Chitinophaga oryzae]QJB32312.1 IS3 family transposase [Chitinophaga oryzae]QJB39464.1 IS3 family transposase [Chitinophaga oryzae]